MSHWGRGFASTVLVLATLFPISLTAPPACASETPRAVLVVDTGETQHRWCVSLPAAEVSGLELIELASEQHGLSYKFGFGGEAVCMLAGVGPTGDDCFEDYPNFWGYWRGDGNGGWNWSGSGAGSTTVADGDVEGWSWGSGNDGDTHPRPPATAFEDVCAEATERPPAAKKPKARDNQGPAPSRSGGSGGSDVGPPRRSAPAPAGNTAGDPPGREARVKRPRGEAGGPRKERDPGAAGASDDKAAVTPVGSPSPTALDEQATSALEPADPSGPPVAGLAALAAAALLGGAGFVIAKRRAGRGV